jgi:bacillithiol biosynthesis deacetylase BshB1
VALQTCENRCGRWFVSVNWYGYAPFTVIGWGSKGVVVDVLFIGAHPDDVEWGVGGMALLLKERGISFAIADLTQGELGSRGTVDQRAAEAARAAEFLGASARENLQLPDGGVVDSPGNRRLIAGLVRRYCPQIVLAPLWEDRHPDHAAAGLMVRNAALYCGLQNLDDPHPPHKPAAFLYYPLHQFHKPSFVIDTTAIFPRKLELLGIFASQFAASVGDYLFALESRDRYFGLQAGVRHGEALISDQPIRLGSVSDLLPILR